MVAQLKSELESTEKRLDEIEKAAAAGGGKGGNKGDGKKKEKKEKKGGDAAEKAPVVSKADAARAKEIAAAKKEGGKKAQDIAGMHDMGGMSFFAVTLETCKGDWELIQAAMDGANVVVDESACYPPPTPTPPHPTHPHSHLLSHTPTSTFSPMLPLFLTSP